MSVNRDTKVIGYFAYVPPMNAFCDGDACIVAGSETALRDYIAALNPDDVNKNRVKKTRFGEIMRGIGLGAAYAFDADAYNRFFPLAQEEGLNVGPEDFSQPSPTGMHFVRIEAKFRT
jgi:hypothetical protein